MSLSQEAQDVIAERTAEGFKDRFDPRHWPAARQNIAARLDVDGAGKVSNNAEAVVNRYLADNPSFKAKPAKTETSSISSQPSTAPRPASVRQAVVEALKSGKGR